MFKTIKMLIAMLLTALITYFALSYALDKLHQPEIPKVKDYWVSNE